MKRIAVILLVGTGLLFMPNDSSAIRITVVRTTDMISNESAIDGMRELVNLLGLAGVNITSLQEVAKQHQLHQEGPEAGGVVLVDGANGVTFFPRRRPFLYGRFLVIVNDADTHTVLREDAINDLVNREFLRDTFYLRQTAITAVHELVHAMIFRTGCFKGGVKAEEELVANLVDADISTTVTIYLLWQAGETSTALRLYEGLVSGVAEKLRRHRRWATCYEILGIPGPVPGPIPQLSPWPMFGHDPQHTGQSQYTGPQTIENISWSYDLGFNVNESYGGASEQPVVGSGEIIYFGTGETQYDTKAPWGKLYAFNSGGTLRWESFDFGSPVFNTPAIAPDGTIYVPTYDKGVYALNPDGTEKWRFFEDGMGYISSIALGGGGVIYFTDEQKLYSLSPDGRANWIYCCGPRGGSVRGGPAIGPSGDIYVIWTGFITGTDGAPGGLHTYSPDGTLKWSVGLDLGYTRLTAPAVGHDGTVYFAEGYYSGVGWRLRAISQTGEQMWETPTVGPGYPQGSPVIDGSGNIVVAANWTQLCWEITSCFASGLWAFSPGGVVLWTIGPHGGEVSNNTRFTQPIVDSQGTIFVAENISPGGYWVTARLYSISREGIIKQIIDVPGTVFSSPVIGAQGQLYAVIPEHEEGLLYRIKLYAFGP